MPTVTVVIPAHDAASFVREAVMSALRQSRPAQQVIVVDDGSGDETLGVLETLRAELGDARLSVVSQPNRGVSRARNRGLEMATGELIAFLDADDFWFEHKLEEQVSALERRPEWAAVGSLMEYRGMGGAPLGAAGQAYTEGDRPAVASGSLMPFPMSSILFRRASVVRLGGFDEQLERSQDLDLLARLASEEPIGCVPRVLGVYRIHGTSASVYDAAGQRRAERFVRARLEARAGGGDLAWEEFVAGYRRTPRQWHADQVNRCYRMCGLSVAEGEWARALAYGALAVALGPRYSIRRFLDQRYRRRSR